ncbi:mechanosensitive ion channel [Prevotella bivia]|uniref:mechanosensitive ion channel family protein n=1 Tax=Prevotella bivia TaxID=28125 RepID=UPI00254F7091|nr:mechanosensitive ion channel domain-containing protein [Prevotella bivia]MDK7762801.1 mechanosensitive ion channel [Prevotella bivia]
MLRRLYILCFFLTLLCLPSKAVLQEDSLKNSLSVLRHELIKEHLELTKQLNTSKMFNERVISQLKEFGERSSQVSLMLYSQNNDNVFDLTYACQKATDLWQHFQTQTHPFYEVVIKSNEDIARYDSLINVLSTMYTFGMTERMKIDRNVCLTLASSNRRMLKERNEYYHEFILYYDYNKEQLQSLNTYAQKRYAEIQSSIFTSNGQNYIKFLSTFPYKLSQLKNSITEKYTPQEAVSSQWDVRWISMLFLTFVFYGFLAFVINLIFIKYILTRLFGFKRFQTLQEGFLMRRRDILITSTVICFGIITLGIRFFASNDLVYMASGLILEFVWLVAVIFGSLLLRVSSEEVRYTNRLYYPVMLVGGIVIIYRITFMPGTLVTFSFPIILAIAALWQASLLYRHHLRVPKNDLYLAYISQAVFVFALGCSWLGYSFLAVQFIIWWMMQQACLLTLGCLRNYLDRYKEKKAKTLSIQKRWCFRFVYSVILPTALVLSFIVSILWAADVFNLGEVSKNLFKINFINSKNFKVSIYALALVVVMWFLFNYINKTVRDGVKLYLQAKDPDTAASRSVMLINVVQVVVWGAWLLISLNMLEISSTWLIVVSGGLSTGIGFAMKDILENIYYGISLMAGRIKVGDYIICDGVRGIVSSISYTSTLIEATDGAVIAFQNSQLFTKNYKNMTKNHGYELDGMQVGIAYGSNLKEVKQLLIDAISQLPCVRKNNPASVGVKSFDDSCVTLQIYVWVSVLTHFAADSMIMECIYETLNANNIEIPFPQREITIKKAE